MGVQEQDGLQGGGVSRCAGSWAPQWHHMTKATGEASGMPTGCSSQERKRLRSADVSLEQRVVFHYASSVAKLTQSVTSVAI